MRKILACLLPFALFACAPSDSPTSSPVQVCLSVDGKADATCTPGATNPDVTQAAIGQTICQPGWTDRIRPPTSYTTPLKLRQLASYRYQPHDLDPVLIIDYREDHLIALSLGGAPRDPRNLWPQPVGPAVAKNNHAAILKERVCSGRLSLVEAQNQLLERWLTR